MAFTHGKDSEFKIDDSGGTLRDLTVYITDVDFSEEVDMAETSTKGAEAKTFASGLSNASFSISGRYDNTALSGPAVVLKGLVGAETATDFEWYPEGSASGKAKYTGVCFITSYSQSSPLGDIVSFSADVQVSGAVTKALVA